MLTLGKDSKQLEVSCADFLVSEQNIYFLVADDTTLHVLRYDPDDPSSLSGQLLIRKSEFHLGGRTQCLKSFVPHNEMCSPEYPELSNIGVRSDGSLFYITPVSESTYRRLYVIQQQLIEKETHYAGLNPSEFRNNHQVITTNMLLSRPILDSNLILGYTGLSIDRRRALSLKIGSGSTGALWKDLINLENITKNF